MKRAGRRGAREGGEETEDEEIRMADERVGVESSEGREEKRKEKETG